MKYKAIAEKIIELKNIDLEFRNRLVQSGQIEDGYNKEMEQIHNRHATILNEIIDSIGYPSIEKVGKEACESSWLVIQHSIGQPWFMKKCSKLLEREVKKNNADPKNLAYLTDRIAVLEGKPQLYGTQFDWDSNGEFNPQKIDDLARVNQRRKSIALNTLEEQTLLMREQVKKEQVNAPKDLEKRKMEYDAWRKKVGWIEK